MFSLTRTETIEFYSKFKAEPREIQDEKSRKDTANSGKLVSTITA